MMNLLNGDKKSKKFAPLKLTVIYIIGTFLIAAIGPIEYLNFAKGITALFLGWVILFSWIGYAHGVKAENRNRSYANYADFNPNDSILFVYSVTISLFSLFLSMTLSAWSGNFNVDLYSLGQTYIDQYESYERNTGSYSWEFLIYTLSSPFNFIAFVWGIFYFRRLSSLNKFKLYLLVVSSLYFYVVGTGKQKQIGDIVIYYIAASLMWYGSSAIRFRIGSVIRIFMISLSGIIAMLFVLGQRYSAIGVGYYNINDLSSDRMFVDFNHVIFDIFGPEIGLRIAMFGSYLSQGYYGLSLALQTDWQWTRFQGFSYSLSVIMNRFFGLEWQWPNSLLYQVGLRTGWGESKWHTVFTYFATDFTFPGTVVLFGFFSVVYAKSWIGVTISRNPYAVLTFTLLTFGVFFIPANNQLLHTPGGLLTVAFVSILSIWRGRLPAVTQLKAPHAAREHNRSAA